jgi:hypothetical protein
MPSSDTREFWLLQAVERFRPRFADLGKPIPAKARVSVGKLLTFVYKCRHFTTCPVRALRPASIGSHGAGDADAQDNLPRVRLYRAGYGEVARRWRPDLPLRH